MNKKAFVLMETIVVIVVISIALLTIFRSYNKILSKVKSENKYDTSEYIYMTKYIKDYLKDQINASLCSVTVEDITNSATDRYNIDLCGIKSVGVDNFNVKKIYILKNINGGDDSKFKKFDAYMIDYLRKLDVADKDVMIIVEYYKNAKDDKGNDIKIKKNPTESEEVLTETYIASLEWN